MSWSTSPDFLTVCSGGLALEACFAGPALLKHMLAFEVALAAAQAELSMIPAASAAAIARAAEVEHFDLAALIAATRDSATPAIPVVSALCALVAKEDATAAGQVHLGATSQDVVDTALMLAAREALAALDTQARGVATLLSALIAAHRHSLMPARTLTQQAGVTTFGLKAAGWLQGVTRAMQTLRAAATQLPLQFAGATGTLASYGDEGEALKLALARRLELRPVPPWHTERGAVRELAAALAGLAAAGGKIANDLLLLAQTEVGEVSEAAAPGRGGSSALPHKRNPVASVGALAAARRAPPALASVFGAFDHAHERAAGAWHVEMPALVALFGAAGGVLEGLSRALDGLNVDTTAMQRNLAAGRELFLSEAVSMALAPQLGRERAQALLAEACARVNEGRGTLGDLLRTMPAVNAVLSPAALAAALDPKRALGSAEAVMDQALAAANAVFSMSQAPA